MATDESGVRDSSIQADETSTDQSRLIDDPESLREFRTQEIREGMVDGDDVVSEFEEFESSISDEIDTIDAEIEQLKAQSLVDGKPVDLEDLESRKEDLRSQLERLRASGDDPAVRQEVERAVNDLRLGLDRVAEKVS